MLRLPFILALVFALAGTPAFAGGRHRHGHGHGNKPRAAARAAKGQKAEGRLARLDDKWGKRIAGLRQRLNAHPDVPVGVKSAADQLITDLSTAQGDVVKLRAAKQAHDRATRRALQGTLKSDKHTICADHKALRQAVHSAVMDARGILGHKAKHAHKHKKAKA